VKYLEVMKGSLSPKFWKYDYGTVHRDTSHIRFLSRSSQFKFHYLPRI